MLRSENNSMGDGQRNCNPELQGSCGRRIASFSLVEMMLAVGIIVVLVSVVLLVGKQIIDRGREKTTRVVLAQLQEAIGAYRDDNPNRLVSAAQARYGAYPPDDLMAYTPIAGDADNPGAGHGIKGLYEDMPNMMPGGLGTYVKMDVPVRDLTDDYTVGEPRYIANGDIKALVWALRNRERSRYLYDELDPRYRVVVGLEDEYFDMDGDNLRNGTDKIPSSDAEMLVDEPVEYVVDSWGNPLAYYSARELVEAGIPESGPTPHGGASRLLVRANRNQPLLASYGVNGETQIEAGITFDNSYEETPAKEKPFGDAMHQDNVYVNDDLVRHINEMIKDESEFEGQ